jgi:C-terminal processing protease CtpA/Prc
MSAAAHAYLTRALDLLQHNSIDTGQVDWPKLRAEAFELAAEAQTSADTYPAIAQSIDQLHDPHTKFFAPAAASELFDQPTMPDGPPIGRILPGGYAMLTILAMTGNDQAVATYVRQGEQAVRDLDRSHPCGWIIDLRPDQGGNMWPMLTALAPLLTGPTLGYFVTASGQRIPWTLRSGQLFNGDRASIPQSNDYRLSRSEPPAAVLTGSLTASSGEATLVAFRGQPNIQTFGQPTTGLASANQQFTLNDGAVLLITVADDADRTGHVYPNLTPIPPDHRVPASTPRHSTSPESDPVTAAATQWLAGAPACRP